MFSASTAKIHESSKFWLDELNDPKSWDVLDVYLFCTDSLCSMMQAIQVLAAARCHHQLSAVKCIAGHLDLSTLPISLP